MLIRSGSACSARRQLSGWKGCGGRRYTPAGAGEVGRRTRRSRNRDVAGRGAGTAARPRMSPLGGLGPEYPEGLEFKIRVEGMGYPRDLGLIAAGRWIGLRPASLRLRDMRVVLLGDAGRTPRGRRQLRCFGEINGPGDLLARTVPLGGDAPRSTNPFQSLGAGGADLRERGQTDTIGRFIAWASVRSGGGLIGRGSGHARLRMFDVEAVFIFPWATRLEAYGTFGAVGDGDLHRRAGARAALRMAQGGPPVDLGLGG